MIQIRPGTDGDRPQILERMEEVFGAEPARRAERLWDWQWREDPRLPSPGYRGVVADWDGRLIGVLSTIPAGLHIGGEPVQAWWFVDVLVHWGLTRQALREQRRAGGRGATDLPGGIAAALFDHPAAGPIQLGKHIADAMMTIGHRLGFAYLPNTGSLHRRVSMRRPLGRLLGTHLGDLTGAILDLALPAIPRPPFPVRLHEGPFDGRFDRLWESMRPRFPAICRRDAALLEWRYRRHP
ncbi:MAG: GNAT family N-acetyltransferase, partial [Bdellovibrio bacteriovorus]